MVWGQLSDGYRRQECHAVTGGVMSYDVVELSNRVRTQCGSFSALRRTGWLDEARQSGASTHMNHRIGMN